MKLNQYLSERGATVLLARRMSVSSSLVAQWCAGKPISPERAVQIEQETGGVVRRWDCRPQDWHRIWPELINAEGAPVVPVEEARDAA